MLSDIAVFTSQVVNHNVVLWSRVYCSLQFLPWTGSWSEEPKWDLALNFRSLLQRHCVSFGKLMVMRQCISSGTEALQKWKNILERQWVIWKTYHEHQPLKNDIGHWEFVPQRWIVNQVLLWCFETFEGHLTIATRPEEKKELDSSHQQCSQSVNSPHFVSFLPNTNVIASIPTLLMKMQLKGQCFNIIVEIQSKLRKVLDLLTENNFQTSKNASIGVFMCKVSISKEMVLKLR